MSRTWIFQGSPDKFDIACRSDKRTRAESFKLGAIDDNDPLHPGDVRIWLTEEDSVPPGEEHEFTISLIAGDEPGTFTHAQPRLAQQIGV